mmetsp:Transcript_28761/g.76767  ORF Transcript_28761/g.76767 Transcript_28761/m.76767 type:complete len:286 (+) Transcript_28761:2-859(+)
MVGRAPAASLVGPRPLVEQGLVLPARPAPVAAGPASAAPAGAAYALALAASVGALGALRARRNSRTELRAAARTAQKKKNTSMQEDEKPKGPPEPPPFDPATQIGALLPVGYFDPLNICKVGDRGKFRNFREAELKHGRVAMMASVGLVGQHFLKFPGFEAVPSGIRAADVSPGLQGWIVMILFCGYMELKVWKQDPKKEIGDFGDPLGLNMYDDDMRNREISNGRFAMLSVAEIARNEQFSNKDAVVQLQEFIGKFSGGLPVPALPAVELPAVPLELPPVPGIS